MAAIATKINCSAGAVAVAGQDPEIITDELFQPNAGTITVAGYIVGLNAKNVVEVGAGALVIGTLLLSASGAAPAASSAGASPRGAGPARARGCT